MAWFDDLNDQVKGNNVFYQTFPPCPVLYFVESSIVLIDVCML